VAAGGTRRGVDRFSPVRYDTAGQSVSCSERLASDLTTLHTDKSDVDRLIGVMEAVLGSVVDPDCQDGPLG
jgi:hypothetical protein